MLVQEVEGALAIDRVSAVEELNRRSAPKTELIVKPTRLRIFRSDPIVRRDAIVMAPLDHEGPRKHQVSQLRITEGAAHIKIRHFPFVSEHEAVAIIGGRDLAR